jgi:hypothetical protein
VNEALVALSGEFSALYSRSGRPSIPPEKLLRAMMLQAFYSIRSERQSMEPLEFDFVVDDHITGVLSEHQDRSRAALWREGGSTAR